MRFVNGSHSLFWSGSRGTFFCLVKPGVWVVNTLAVVCVFFVDLSNLFLLLICSTDNLIHFFTFLRIHSSSHPFIRILPVQVQLFCVCVWTSFRLLFGPSVSWTLSRSLHFPTNISYVGLSFLYLRINYRQAVAVVLVANRVWPWSHDFEYAHDQDSQTVLPLAYFWTEYFAIVGGVRSFAWVKLLNWKFSPAVWWTKRKRLWPPTVTVKISRVSAC